MKNLILILFLLPTALLAQRRDTLGTVVVDTAKVSVIKQRTDTTNGWQLKRQEQRTGRLASLSMTSTNRKVKGNYVGVYNVYEKQDSVTVTLPLQKNAKRKMPVTKTRYDFIGVLVEDTITKKKLFDNRRIEFIPDN